MIAGDRDWIIPRVILSRLIMPDRTRKCRHDSTTIGSSGPSRNR